MLFLTSAMTIVIWLIEAIALGFLVSAFGVHAGPAGLALILGAVAFGTLIPSAPGYVGSLQAAFVIVFLVLGFDQLTGILSATAMQLILFGSVTIVGAMVPLVIQFRSAVPFMAAQRVDSSEGRRA